MSKQNYEELCKRVEAFDKDAAEYMRNEAPKLGDFEYDGFLYCCFVFRDTPQGLKYWINISDQLMQWRNKMKFKNMKI